MEQFLYEDLYKQEDKHWWHLAKRAAVVELIERLLRRSAPRNDKSRTGQDGRVKILDLGCGTGKNMEVLSQFGETFGVDMSPDALKFCKKRGIKNVKLGSSYKTGFEKSYFDLITLLDVLEHTDDNKTLAEISRILDKNGLLIINVPAFQWLWSKWDEVLHHKRRYSKKTLVTVLKKNGFKVVKISYLFSFLVLPTLVLRLIKSKLSKKEYSSDFNYSNSTLFLILSVISWIERRVMFNFPIPFGTSLICVARKVK